YTAIRALRKTDKPLIIVFWFSVLMSLVFLPSVIRNGVIPDSRSLILLICIGIFGASGQLFMTSAYRYAPGGKVAIYGYLSVIFSMLWQTMFFNSIPSLAVFAGAALILLGGWINYRVR
ncbi:MAG: DMT family transporter, partial [Candidatus Aegiribacteria sp.]|nr:DMT family transporter [Candidatus Aegiribacteria sp.]